MDGRRKDVWRLSGPSRGILGILCIAGAMLSTYGCGGDAAPQEPRVEVDADGVRRAVWTALPERAVQMDTLAVWDLWTSPAADQGGEGSGHLFGGVDDVVGAREGFFLLDAPSRVVIPVGPDGQAGQPFGGEGSGPGELRLPLHLDVMGDEVWVSDVLNRRFTVFSPAGSFLRTLPWPGGLRLVNPFEVTGSERVIYGGMWPLTVAELAQQPPVHYVASSRIPGGGEESRARVDTDTLVTVRAAGYHSVVLTSQEGDQRTWFGTPILGVELHWSVLPGGEVVTVTGPDLAFEVRDATGRVRARVAVEGEVPPVSGEWKRWYVDEVLEMRSLEGAPFTPTYDAVDLLPFAERIQRVAGITVDPLGRIWLQVRGDAPGTDRVELFTAEGAYLGSPGPGPLPAAFLVDGRALVRVPDAVEGADAFIVVRPVVTPPGPGPRGPS